MKKRKLVLENGLVFSGRQFGADTEGVFELVFNTAMAGYQEIISDPAYCDSIVVMSYPLIGSYGITDEDYESRMMTLGGMVVREYIDQPSNFRYTKTLSETFEENGVAGLCGVDTRRIVRVIRDCGTMKAMITDEDTPLDAALGKLRSYVMPTDQVARCSCRKRRYARTQNHRFTVAVIDCGAKLSIIRELNERGCNVVILPYDTTAEQLRGIRPDGVVFSNGPGSPENIPQTSLLVKEVYGKLPLLGIGLGMELVALSRGAKVYRMKFGHHGGGSVRDLRNGRIEMTSQNHSYAVETQSVDGTGLKITHTNVIDGTVEGLCGELAICVQYQPESAPGSQDSKYIFDEFIKMMEGFDNAKAD